jgi:hypothetical protein
MQLSGILVGQINGPHAQQAQLLDSPPAKARGNGVVHHFEITLTLLFCEGAVRNLIWQIR